jgi:O-antigen ligase
MIVAVGVAALLFIYIGYRNPTAALFAGAVFFHLSFFTNLFAEYDIALSRIIVFCLFCSCVVRLLAKKDEPFSLEIIGFLLITFILFAGFSLFYAAEGLFGARKFIYIVSIVPVYFIVRQLLGGSSDVRRAFFMLQVQIGAVVGSLQFLSQFTVSKELVARSMVTLSPFLYGNNFGALVVRSASWFVHLGGKDYFRAISIFPDPHTFAVYLGFVIPPLFAVLLIGKKRNMLYWVGLAGSLLALLFTFSRGGYLSFFGFLVWFVVFGSYFLRKSRQFVLISAVFCFCSILLLFPFGTRLLQVFNPQERSFADRTAIMAQGVALWSKNPFLGAGIGNYPYMADHNALYRSPINAHNTYIESVLRWGLLACFYGY